LANIAPVVVGHEEMEQRQLNIRYRDDTDTQSRGTPVALDAAIEKLVKLRDERATYNPFPASTAAGETKEVPVRGA
jgi:threonyl-tRNA synthetase